jgi:DNA-binding transcriptional ArsR family regulator
VKEQPMDEFLDLIKALSDVNRLRILMFLRRGELCLCQIIEMLRLAPSTVSKHVSILRQARVIDARKEGRWHYYRLADDAPAHVRQALDWALASLRKDPIVRADAKRLDKVLRRDVQALCEHYKRG